MKLLLSILSVLSYSLASFKPCHKSALFLSLSLHLALMWTIDINHFSLQVTYLNDYATKLKLKVQYNTNIQHVSRKGEGDQAVFYLKDQNGTQYTCKNLIIR